MSRNANRLIKVILNFALIAAVGLGLFWGCEDDANTDIAAFDEHFESHPYNPEDLNVTASLIKVSPPDITVSCTTREFELTARGGTQPYRWAVANSGRGTIREISSQRAKYVPLQVAANSITVTDKNGYVAVVPVLRAAADTLRIIPNAITISTNVGPSNVVFVVTGGIPPYTWSNARQDHGAMAGSTYNYNSLTQAEAGDDTITVIDSEGTSASATVTRN